MADVVVRAYKDSTLVKHRVALGMQRAMAMVEDKAKKSIQSKSFNKHVIVANKRNGNGSFDEV